MKRLIPVLLLSAGLGGCGTYFNMAGVKCSGGDKDVYGGVQADVVHLAGACPPWTVLCGLVDFPFSLVADTLTLPWTASHHPRPRE